MNVGFLRRLAPSIASPVAAGAAGSSVAGPAAPCELSTPGSRNNVVICYKPETQAGREFESDRTPDQVVSRATSETFRTM